MKIEIKITVTDEGQILVTGPINDKILCYGLLEIARDVVRDYNPEEKSNIIIPKLAMVRQS